MNFLKKFLGSSPTDEVISIPSGKLFLTRSPQSPKGELECLYNDAFASIRQTTSAFYYRLVITRVYQEGELAAHGDSGFGDSDDEDEFNDHDTPHSISDSNIGLGHSKDEYVFEISEDLKIHCYDKEDGTKAISWKDLDGDLGDRFEFIVDEITKQTDIDSFMLALYKCQYERKYHKSSLEITTTNELKEFVYDPKTELLSFNDLNKDIHDFEYEEDEYEYEDETKATEPPKVGAEAGASEVESDGDDEFHDAEGSIGGTNTSIVGTVVYEFKTNLELYLFSPDTGTFIIKGKKNEVCIKILDSGDWNYYLVVDSIDENGRPLKFDCPFTKDMNPTFNFTYNSFVFNHFVQSKGQSIVFSWLLKFEEESQLSEFQVNFSTQLWQAFNKTIYNPPTKDTTDSEMDYVMDTLSNFRIDDETGLDEEDEKNLDDMSDDDGLDDGAFLEAEKIIRNGKQNLFVPEDDEDDEYGDYENDRKLSEFKQSDKNSNLSVGYSNDRSYVVRGNKLGVFKNDDDEVSYQTTIANMTNLKGKDFIPKSTMLHMQDQYMIMQNPEFDDKKLFKMDLERGKIVEEWDVHDQQAITSFGPNTKFSQLTAEQTLTGVSKNGMFRIDPRLPTSKLVNDNTFKLYKTKYNDFSSMATTQHGHIAVGSKKGDIRLYDRLGINAKSALPSLGEPIIGLDVSADGRWLLATCETYLLLIDTKIGDNQRNAGELGFLKSFDKDKKPKPRRLTIKPEHVAYMSLETGGKPLSFTKAHFNTGLDSKETSIVTSSGPYVISWSLKKVLQPPKKSKNTSGSSSVVPEDQSYLIKKYSQNVIADNFKFGSNADVILALQDDVEMTNKKVFSRPSKIIFGSTKNSIVKEF
ncbi:vacuolar import and degradation protein 27 [[Candida] anglica]|uniref:Vacuolar import and degradation protein 27 n=1 Tax=[Candida] anglica TaxID=148631 RepID=A0ABP0EP33_9ASCO